MRRETFKTGISNDWPPPPPLGGAALPVVPSGRPLAYQPSNTSYRRKNGPPNGNPSPVHRRRTLSTVPRVSVRSAIARFQKTPAGDPSAERPGITRGRPAHPERGSRSNPFGSRRVSSAAARHPSARRAKCPGRMSRASFSCKATAITDRRVGSCTRTAARPGAPTASTATIVGPTTTVRIGVSRSDRRPAWPAPVRGETMFGCGRVPLARAPLPNARPACLLAPAETVSWTFGFFLERPAAECPVPPRTSAVPAQRRVPGPVLVQSAKRFTFWMNITFCPLPR